MDDMTSYGSIAAAKAAGISLRQLYYWVDVLGIVQPQLQQYGSRSFRRFSTRDLQQLKLVRRLMRRGYTLRAARKMIRLGGAARQTHDDT